MSKFKKGDIVRRKFMDVTFEWLIIGERGTWYTLMDNGELTEALIIHIDKFYELKTPTQITNV